MPTPTTTTGLSLRQLAERDERAFPSYPHVARYFPAASIEDARARLGRAIERGDGPGLVIGGPGTGKSLLLQVLASQYHERFDVVLPACARLCTRRALLQAILFELGLPYKIREEGDLRLSLLDHLLSREECPSGLLLLVDEAHTLSTALLDELRVLTNLVRGGLPRVRLVLAGSSALEECFADPELESFSQRLSARCYLGPFGREETSQFVRAQLSGSGASPDELLAADACAAIFDATDGVPRLVNQLCDRALVAANAAGRSRIDRQTIQAAWSDIQQLPTPWDTPEPTVAPTVSPQVIEFGNLVEDRPRDIVPTEYRVIDDRSDDYELADVELTDLDDADDDLTDQELNVESAAELTLGDTKHADPFAEQFDEEEVVLDNFAAWDDMFSRAAQRVQNRRDPEFATLVQAAISTVDEEVVDAYFSTTACLNGLQSNHDGTENAAHDFAAFKPTNSVKTNDRPSLRIADISDATPAPSMPKSTAIESRRQSNALIAKPITPPESFEWPSENESDHDNDDLPLLNTDDEEPVLIVEDDVEPLGPPVRREQYRNLFSRLRSG